MISYLSVRKWWLYIALVLIMAGCLWVGWRDFDPWLSQNDVRENIRSSIRGIIQITIQYAIPLAILVFFAREAITAKKRRVHLD